MTRADPDAEPARPGVAEVMGDTDQRVGPIDRRTVVVDEVEQCIAFSALPACPVSG
jgi:hypothetical protein